MPASSWRARVRSPAWVIVAAVSSRASAAHARAFRCMSPMWIFLAGSMTGPSVYMKGRLPRLIRVDFRQVCVRLGDDLVVVYMLDALQVGIEPEAQIAYWRL